MTSIFKRIFITVLFFCFATNVVAQVIMPTTNTGTAEISLPDPLTPENVRDLVATLSDTQVRAMLLERLDAVAESETKKDQEANGSLLDFAKSASMGVYQSIAIAIERLPVLWSSQKESFSNFNKLMGNKGPIVLFGSLFLTLFAGLIAEFATNKITRRWHASELSTEHPDTLGQTLRFLMFRLLHELYGLIAFFIVARFISRWLIPLELMPIFKVIVFNLIVVPRIGAAFARFVLAPKQPEFRLLNTDDKSAQFLYRHLIGILLLMGLTFAIVTFNSLNGVAVGTTRIGFWLNTSVHIYGLLDVSSGLGDVSV